MQEAHALFEALYPTWCHSVSAVLCLAFLAEAYEHGTQKRRLAGSPRGVPGALI